MKRRVSEESMPMKDGFMYLNTTIDVYNHFIRNDGALDDQGVQYTTKRWEHLLHAIISKLAWIALDIERKYKDRAFCHAIK